MGNYLEALFVKGSEIATRLDNWQNLVTGLGTSRDKTTHGSFVGRSRLPDTELAALYRDSDTARRILSTKPKETLRRGVEVSFGDDQKEEDRSEAKKELDRLGVFSKFIDGQIWGKLYGGALLIIGAEDGQAAGQPLNEEGIRTIKYLKVIDRRYISVESWYDNPSTDEKFGEPKVYRVNPRRGASSLIHESRVIRFGGAHTDDEEKDRLDGWDNSVMTYLYDPIRQFDAAWKASEILMVDASQGIFKIKNLMQYISGGKRSLLQARMELVDMGRSVARALLLDADGGESFERQTADFLGIDKMLDKFAMRLASAAEYPLTILMGQSPAGMNATGDSDLTWWYDTIASEQEDLKPRLKRLIGIILSAADSPVTLPETWDISFLPLWQPSAKEQAEIEKITAERDAIYIDREVVHPEEIALSRFQNSGWSATTTIDRESREQILKVVVEQAVETAENPPEPPVMNPPGTPPQQGAPDGSTSPDQNNGAAPQAQQEEDQQNQA